MQMKAKTFLAGVIAMVAVSSTNAAVQSNTQGQGTVNFKGVVVDAPCGIAQESADQTIDFGQVSKTHLENGGTSVKKDLDIKLVNCEIDPTTTKKVSVSFSGTLADNTHSDELGTAGDTGTVIVVSGSDGKLVPFDGTKSNETQLKAGDNNLKYSTWVKKGSAGTIKEGAFTAVASFNLTYQ